MPFKVSEVHVLGLNLSFQLTCAAQACHFFVEHDAVALVSELSSIN